MKMTQSRELRVFNRIQVLEEIIRVNAISRTELCDRTGLNKATVSTITREWMEKGLLMETEHLDSMNRRRPVLLEPMYRAGVILAVDIFSHQAELALFDLSARNQLRYEFLPLEQKEETAVFEALCSRLDQWMKELPQCRYGLVGMGVSVHGIVNLNGEIAYIPTRGFWHLQWKTAWEERYHCPVSVDNDGHCAALYHYQQLYSGTPLDSLCVVNISDTLSTGFISGGRLLRGQHGFAGAVGHYIIQYGKTSAAPAANPVVWSNIAQNRRCCGMPAPFSAERFPGWKNRWS